MKIRLQKLLSAAGVASRRAAERLMAEGRVSVNGKPVTELGTRADPEHEDIRVDGRRVTMVRRRIYLLLNKPRGYVTTRSDPEGRRTILDLIPRVREYLYPVGRLDYDSEGLLLVTNDGDLAARLMHPRYEVERTYHARVRGVPDDDALTRLARGIVIDGRRTAPARVRRLTPHPSGSERGWGPASTKKRPRGLAGPGALHPSARASARPRGLVAPGGGAPGALKNDDSESTIEITIHEGRSRQVRRMCEAVEHPIVRLQRVRFGPIADHTLKAGTYRELTPREVALLKRATSRD
jgi:23S rRNA pseudouridine2605 synthase